MDQETKETVRKLKESADLISSHLPGDGEGMLVFGTGVSVIRTNHPVWTQSLRYSNDEIRTMYMVSHECVHLSQVISTEFVFYTGFGFLELVASIQRNKKQGTPELDWLEECLKNFNFYNELIDNETAGISALQIIEAHAVLEGFRGAFSRWSQEGLVMIINEVHELSLLYSDLIGKFLKEFGFEFTFNALPKICWLSLQSKKPGVEFLAYMEKLIQYPAEKIAELNCSEFCALLGVDPMAISKTVRQRNPDIARHQINKLWGPYFDEIEAEHDVESLLEYFMHPGKESSTTILNKQYLMPPLTIFNDDHYHLNGPHKEGGWSVAKPLIEATALYLETLRWLDEKSDTK